MRILFVTNLPSPYRVDFFNELGKLCELTALYERRSASDRNEKWKGNKAVRFKEKYIDLKPIGADRSIGLRLVKEIKKQCFDHLIISGYASPSVMAAIVYCRLKRIPYYIESDGGFCKKDKFPKSMLKKFLLSGAKGHFVTCDEYKKYLLSLGVKNECIYKYPFTSLKSADIIAEPVSSEEKENLKNELSLKESKVVLAVGQFIKRKGFDILIKAAKNLPANVGVYFVGGVPTEEYITLKNSLQLENVHFVGFKTKEDLKLYYKAADVFVLPTREDIWGLVINEAMVCGLPVVTTDRCIAGLELVKNGENGYITETENPVQLADCIEKIINDGEKCAEMGKKSLDRISEYTVENMAERHISVLSSNNEMNGSGIRH